MSWSPGITEIDGMLFNSDITLISYVIFAVHFCRWNVVGRVWVFDRIECSNSILQITIRNTAKNQCYQIVSPAKPKHFVKKQTAYTNIHRMELAQFELMSHFIAAICKLMHGNIH